MIRPILVGLGATIGSIAVGSALVVAGMIRLGGGDTSGAGFLLLIYWPVLILVTIGSIVLGLWIAHRSYRRSVTARAP